MCSLSCGSLFTSAFSALIAGDLTNAVVDSERKARVEEVWKQMNSGLPVKVPKPFVNKSNSTELTTTKKTIPVRMLRLTFCYLLIL